jgi:hypothetical protein
MVEAVEVMRAAGAPVASRVEAMGESEIGGEESYDMITRGYGLFWFVGGGLREVNGREGKKLHERENVTEAPESLTMTTVELDWI